MKTLIEHISQQEDLDEGVIRTGAIAAYGARARKEGDDSVRAFKQAKRVLSKSADDISIEAQLKRIEQSLDFFLDGLIAQRQQIGSGIAVDVAGHILAAKARKKR